MEETFGVVFIYIVISCHWHSSTPYLRSLWSLSCDEFHSPAYHLDEAQIFPSFQYVTEK